SGHDAPLKESVKRWLEFTGQGSSDPEVDAAAAQWRKKCNLPDEPETTGHHHHHGSCDVQKEVTAFLVNMKSPSDVAMFSSEKKRGHGVQAVNPIIPMRRLMDDIIGNVRT